MMTTRIIASACLSAAILLGVPAIGHAQVGKSVTIVDANITTEADLAKLTPMTPAIAKALVAQRPFLTMASLDAFLQKQGLTRMQLTELYAKLFLHLNLNTATDAEILLIPGLGNRMLREFKEYRPYKALAQFHREIGKYVDNTELARLEQYVFSPIDLNTGSDADILTIPGMGNRMLREFKEYRPYKQIEVFRREIDKYVSKEEVARLERYVTIN